MAFSGRNLDGLDEDEGEEILTGAMLVASAFDDIRATRIYFEGLVKALGKKRR